MNKSPNMDVWLNAYLEESPIMMHGVHDYFTIPLFNHVTLSNLVIPAFINKHTFNYEPQEIIFEESPWIRL